MPKIEIPQLVEPNLIQHPHRGVGLWTWNEMGRNAQRDGKWKVAAAAFIKCIPLGRTRVERVQYAQAARRMLRGGV